MRLNQPQDSVPWTRQGAMALHLHDCLGPELYNSTLHSLDLPCCSALHISYCINKILCLPWTQTNYQARYRQQQVFGYFTLGQSMCVWQHSTHTVTFWMPNPGVLSDCIAERQLSSHIPLTRHDRCRRTSRRCRHVRKSIQRLNPCRLHPTGKHHSFMSALVRSSLTNQT